METKRTFQLQDIRHYEAPLTRVFDYSLNGVLCMSSEVSTESYDVLEEFEW